MVQEGMDDWDQETLEKAVAAKHGNEQPVNATNIICKHFLDAVEKRLYGWCAVGPSALCAVVWPICSTSAPVIPATDMPIRLDLEMDERVDKHG